MTGNANKDPCTVLGSCPCSPPTLDSADRRVGSRGHWHSRRRRAARRRATGAFVGRAGLTRFEPWTDVEVAYALVLSAWGKGYASEVAARSLRYAHEVVGARGVASHILAGNAAAVRVAERLGATYAHDADERVKGMTVRVYVYPDPR